MPDLYHRLRLFAFTQAEHRARYLAVLRAFDEAREASRLQLGPTDLLVAVPDLHTIDSALATLDQLHDWGLLERLQDDRRVRTIAEYRQRRSIYQMTELGWMAWNAVETVLAAQPGEAELRRLVLPMVLEQLTDLSTALDAGDGERTALLLDRIHATLADVAEHAARFTLATSELAGAWETDPHAFLQHKNRLLTHLDGFLVALSEHRPALARAVAAVDARHDQLVALAVGSSPALDGQHRAEARLRRHWDGVLAWFIGRPEQPSHAAQLEERMSRAIRDLAVLLKRVLDTTAGGISRASQLEELATWFAELPDDHTAHALAAAASGLDGCRHVGVPEADPDATAPTTSWRDGTPAPVDTTLRKQGRASAPPPPRPVPERRREQTLLRQRQQQRRDAVRAAGDGLIHAFDVGRPLEELELRLLLRLLSRALHTRSAASGSAHTVRGRLRLRVTPDSVHTDVPTVRGTLRIEDHRVTVSSSGSAP